MMASTRERRWVEENGSPPVDLRLVPAALAIWAGLLIGLLSPQSSWWIAGLVVFAMIGICLLRIRYWPSWAAILVCLAASIVIISLRTGERANDPLVAGADRGSFATLSVIVSGFPRAVDSGFVSPDNGDNSVVSEDSSRWRVDVTVEEAAVAGQSWASRADLTIYGEGTEWSEVVPGEQIAVSGRLAEQAFGSTQMIVVRARDPPDVTASAPWWNRGAMGIRETLSDNASRLDGDPAGLLPGLVVGDTSGIDERLAADAKTTGITHLLAVSGSHFAILCGMVVVALRRFGPRVAVCGGVVTLIGLVILVGPQPSVLRAAVMGGIGMLALLTGRTRSCVPALASAVIVLLLVDPDLAISIGFTLSVLATGGLILIAPAWSQSLQRRGVPAGWADLLAVPMAAQVVTMPVVVLISGSVSVVAVLANVLVAPVVAPALLLGVLCALTGPWWPWAGATLAEVVAPLLQWVAIVAHTLARWPNATVPWPATPTGALILALLTLGSLMLLRHRRFRELFAAVAAGMTLVLVPSRVIAPGWPPADWLLTACEVGQGDAMVLSTGDEGTALVVDTGPDPDLVDSCLDRLGIGTIPLLILTHLHADHIDGLAGAMHGRTVGAIAVGPGREPLTAWQDVLEQASERAISVFELIPGVQWSSGELNLTALGPSTEFHGTDSDPNNDSLVVMAERQGGRILMTGDIEIEAQQALLNSGADLDADVFKVPHHGSSKLLDRFVRAVSPTLAVIGVGVDNDYGHPSGRALDLLAKEGVSTILRTDEQGDVAVGMLDGALTAEARGATARSGT
jgi:competence protein ComEC